MLGMICQSHTTTTAEIRITTDLKCRNRTRNTIKLLIVCQIVSPCFRGWIHQVLVVGGCRLTPFLIGNLRYHQKTPAKCIGSIQSIHELGVRWREFPSRWMRSNHSLYLVYAYFYRILVGDYANFVWLYTHFDCFYAHWGGFIIQGITWDKWSFATKMVPPMLYSPGVYSKRQHRWQHGPRPFLRAPGRKKIMQKVSIPLKRGIVYIYMHLYMVYVVIIYIHTHTSILI
jgi:hypothetical protein